ncbi:hypothetical protein LTR08_003717 [Meristemomyces frigidus]|nr:hypothetical protein LTR08_003717 [Meristemomyces frigidus]
MLAVSCLLCLGLLKHLSGRPSASVRWAAHDVNSTSQTTSTPRGNATTTHSPQQDADCQQLQGLEDVVIVLKTGATEIYEKLPIHLATTFACAPSPLEYLVYSDIGQRFGPVLVRDVLALVSQEMRDTHEGLAQYRRLQQHVALGADAAELKGEKSWGLDKYKFLPMVSDAYHTFGAAKKWYVLHNLLLWLDTLDARQSIYAGAQVMIGNTEFAHGGSGFVMSAPAAKGMTDVYETQQAYWERKLADECGGDKLMAEVLLEADPPIHHLRSFPLIQGETLMSLDWSPTHWCNPAVTWHHVDAAGIDKLWQFERVWRGKYGARRPILFADDYDGFVRDRLTATHGAIDGWDNLSKDWEYERGIIIDPSYESAAACAFACVSRLECLQWAWRPRLCRHGKTVRLGWALNKRPALGSAEDRVAHTEDGENEGAVSGWLLVRIEAFRREQGSCER